MAGAPWYFSREPNWVVCFIPFIPNNQPGLWSQAVSQLYPKKYGCRQLGYRILPRKNWGQNFTRNLLELQAWIFQKKPIYQKRRNFTYKYMEVSKNRGFFPPKTSIKKIGFSIIFTIHFVFTIHFGWFSPYFWKHPYGRSMCLKPALARSPISPISPCEHRSDSPPLAPATGRRHPLPSLKRTANAPDHSPGPKRKFLTLRILGPSNGGGWTSMTQGCIGPQISHWIEGSGSLG